tara:strand:- start:1225 stop:1782 length:558 start_codon:yes stop_codon:yes gene_type:complete
MAFWNLAASEPKRQHRFLVNFSNLVTSDGASFEDYLAKTVLTPGYTVSTTTHRFLGNEYHYPGTVTWDEVTVSIVNAINPDGNALLYDALAKSGYLKPDDQYDALQGSTQQVGTVNKVNAHDAIGDVIIRQLDGEGTTVGTWNLNNAFITGAKFGTLDYAGDDLLNVDITIRYDWATYESSPPLL